MSTLTAIPPEGIVRGLFGAMAINAGQNMRRGPGGSARRLHHECWLVQRTRLRLGVFEVVHAAERMTSGWVASG